MPLGPNILFLHVLSFLIGCLTTLGEIGKGFLETDELKWKAKLESPFRLEDVILLYPIQVFCLFYDFLIDSQYGGFFLHLCSTICIFPNRNSKPSSVPFFEWFAFRSSSNEGDTSSFHSIWRWNISSWSVGHTIQQRRYYLVAVSFRIPWMNHGFVAGSHVWLQIIWKEESGPQLQLYNLLFGVGGIIAPFICEPFLSSRFVIWLRSPRPLIVLL